MAAAVDDGAAAGARGFSMKAGDVQAKRCQGYLARLQGKVGGGGGGARTLELCMDDARFSAKEHCIAIAFGNGWTAYPPPQVLRELAWKANPDDSGLSAVDQERCRKKGLRGIEMMRSFDMLRCVDRLANISAGWGLEAIRLCVPLLPVQPGQVRFWSKKRRPGCVKTWLWSQWNLSWLVRLGFILTESTSLVHGPGINQ